MVKIPGFHCRSLSSIPDQGTEVPQVVQHSSKKKKREENIFLILTVRIQKVHLTTSKSAADCCLNFDQKPPILNSILFIFIKICCSGLFKL